MKPPPYGVIVGALIAISAAYAGVIESNTFLAMVKSDRSFISSVVVILLAALAAAYRRPKLEFAGLCVAIGGLPYLARWAANEWAKDQPFVPSNCFVLGEGATGMLIGAVIMLFSYLSDDSAPWADRPDKDAAE